MSLDESPGIELAPTAGQYLRRVREERRMSLEALAASLKVPLWQLQALEADDLSAFKGGPSLVRALASSVCRALRIDSHAVLSMLPELQNPVKVTSSARPRQPVAQAPVSRMAQTLGSPVGERHTVRWAGALALVLALGLGAWQWQVGGMDALLAGWPDEVDAPTPAELQAPVSTESSALPAGTVSEPQAGQQVPEVLPQASEPQAIAGPKSSPAHIRWAHELVFSATEQSSWIEVRDPSGEVLSSGLLAAGQSLRVGSQGPMVVVVGNPEFVQVSHQSRTLDLRPWVRFKVARFEVNP